MNLNDKQQHILNTAEQLFACKGFDGTSIRDIAEAANVNIAMISYYFGSKEKLMQALFIERTRKVTERLEELSKEPNISPAEKVNTLIEEHVYRVYSQQQFFKVMFLEQVLEKNTIVTELLLELKQKNLGLIQEILKEGAAKKQFKANVDAVMLANTLIGITMQSVINKSYYKVHHKLQSLTDEAFDELLKEKTTNHIKELYKAILNYEA